MEVETNMARVRDTKRIKAASNKRAKKAEKRAVTHVTNRLAKVV